MLYSREMGGIVLTPDDSTLLCGYAADGGTRAKACADVPPVSPGSVGRPGEKGYRRCDKPRCKEGWSQCIPGCLAGEKDGWCPPRDTQGGWCLGRPFKPMDIGLMLEKHRGRLDGEDAEHRPRQYNEIIIDAYLYAERLPESVAAFFYLHDARCAAKCQRTARESIALYRSTYPHAPSVPMLVLDLGNAEEPFSDGAE